MLLRSVSPPQSDSFLAKMALLVGAVSAGLDAMEGKPQGK